MKDILPSSFKFVFKGLAVGSLRHNVFLVSKKDCVRVSNTLVLSSHLCQYHFHNLCWNKIIFRLTPSNVFECVNNIYKMRVKVCTRCPLVLLKRNYELHWFNWFHWCFILTTCHILNLRDLRGYHDNHEVFEQTFTCSKATIEILGKGVKDIQS